MKPIHFAAAATAVLLSAFVYDRSSILGTFYYNAPGRLAEVRDPSYHFKHVHKTQVRNCEDIYLNESEQWAIVSCDPGRDTWNTVMGTFVEPAPEVEQLNDSSETGLYLYSYAIDELSKIRLLNFKVNAADFHPLGIEYDPSSRTLFVVNHAFSGSRIEVFTLQSDTTTALHIRTIQHPLLATPNSILALSTTELLVTNDHLFKKRTHPLLSTLETVTGLPGGSVTYVKLGEGTEPLRASVVARVAFANGIVHINETTIAVASSSAGIIRLFELQRKDNTVLLKHKSNLAVPFIPDNLSVATDGMLLIAGHPHSPSLTKVAKNVRFCSSAARSLNATLDSYCEQLRQSYLSWIMTWTPSSGLTTIYAGQASFGTSTTAVWDNAKGIGIASGLYESGLLRWTQA